MIFLPIRLLNNIIYGHGVRTIVGYAWYTRETYAKLIEGSDDELDILIATYDQWKKAADQRIKEMNEKGWLVIKVNIQYDDLKKWLGKNGLANIAQTREQYVDERLENFLEDASI